MGASAVAVYALDVARDAKSAAAGGASAGPQAAPSAPAATAAPSATPSPTAPPVAFQPELVRAELNIPAAVGCASVFVDVDTIQVGTYTGHEFYLSSCLGPQSIRIDRTSGATPTAENPTPEACAAQLAGTATATELVLQARAGLTFCLMTNKEDAASQGIPQRIGIVEVREVRPDRSLAVVISTYRVPGLQTN